MRPQRNPNESTLFLRGCLLLGMWMPVVVLLSVVLVAEMVHGDIRRVVVGLLFLRLF